MKKLFLFIMICLISGVYAYAEDYDSMYESAELFKSKLYNDIDPFEDEDSIRYAYSPYPLFRTAADMYLKELKIEPGYYTIVPRTLNDKEYVFFKQNGKVQYIIPVVKKENTPINFYEANTPQPARTKLQKFTDKVRDKFYEKATNSMKVPPPKSFINVDYDTKYIVLVLYYGEGKYTTIFKRTPY